MKYSFVDENFCKDVGLEEGKYKPFEGLLFKAFAEISKSEGKLICIEKFLWDNFNFLFR